MAIIIPEVYSEVLKEKTEGQVKIAQFAVELQGLDEFAEEGDKVSFPRWSALSDAEDLTKGNAITAEQLAQTKVTKTVKHKAKGVTIYDIDAREGKGNFVENAVMQQARIFAKAYDDELVKDIDSNATLKGATAGASAITEAELINGLNLFGDDQDNDSFDGIVINSKLLPSFYSMDGFTNLNKSYVAEGNGVIVNGVIGYYRGTIPVVLSDVNTYDSTKSECKSYIIKKNALGKKSKTNGTNIELERDASKKATNVYADDMFVVGLIDTEGVAILRKTIA